MLAYATLKCRWLLILLFFSVQYSHAQLKADFSASPVSGCAPLVVTFKDLTSGNPTNWKWDLGNGTISFLQNPAVTYFTPGKYNIKLISRNSSGIDSIVKTQFITVQGSPLVSFQADKVTGCFPLAIQFVDASLAGSGTIIKREWDFGDGNISNLPAPQHVYGAAGKFNVSLRITNSTGCVTTVTKPQYIQINTGVKADFSNNVPNSCNPPVTINFINQSLGTGSLSYQWDFGDGTSSTTFAPSHTYTSIGSYTVKLIVKNSTGCADTMSRQNAITLGAVKANISLPTVLCQGTPLQILNTSVPAPANVSWQFGDGTFSDSVSPTKSYANAGSYMIKMVASFGACKDSILQSITILDKPLVNFTADQTNSCKAPFTVNFSGTSTGVTAVTWDFGDSTTSTSINPTHIYKAPGIYAVKLVGTNAAGCSASIIKDGFIIIQLPSVTIDGLPLKGCAPFAHTFSSTIQTAEPITSYQWNFGDGTTSSGSTPAHVFSNPGSYNIRLIVTTQGGCMDTITVTNGIVVGTKPKANFSADQTDVCASVNINFMDLSTGNVNQWLWQFGDGGTSTDKNAGHTYVDTGYFDVTLIAWNNGCSDTTIFKKYIHINPPVAAFTVQNDCDNPFIKDFTDQSIGADTWEWDFGDQTASSSQSPVHVYAAQGNYFVKLKVTNKTTGCAYTKTEIVPVINDKADFVASANSICKGSTISFQTQNINPANIADYHWKFGDGAETSGILPSIQRTYNTTGNYSVTLIILNTLGCSDTLTKSLSAAVTAPSAGFTTSQPGTCINSSIIFADTTHQANGNAIKSWTWDYGDGIRKTDTASTVQHQYTAAGTYTVSLIVVDTKGCADSMVKTGSLIISKPIASFLSPDTLSCSDKPIRFSNGSTGLGLSYLWDFGDGNASTASDPMHKYISQGVYSVSVIANDQFGCIDTFKRSKYINVSNPVANFLMSDSISTCPPLVVTFTNTSVNIVDHAWDFGDGTTSLLNNPTHFYSTPGTFNVVLSVTGPGGCTDTISKKILVNGPTGSFTYSNIVGCNPVTTSFTGTTTKNISFVWDFSDGTTISTRDSLIQHTYTNPGSYLPKMILVDPNGCQVPITGIDTIKVFGVAANFGLSQTTLCDSGSVDFTDSSASNDKIASYLWNFGDGGTSNVKNPLHSYTATGSYLVKLIVTSAFGCKDTANFAAPVKIVASPRVAISGGDNQCIPASESFSGKLLMADTSLLTWKWDMGNGNIYAQQIPIVQHYKNAGKYDVLLTVTNSSGCKNSVSKSFEAYPLPTVQTSPDSWLCAGQSNQLYATGAVNYTWSPSTGLSCTQCTDPVAKPDSAIKYYVKGTSAYGCIGNDSVVLSVKYPFRIQVSANTSVCRGAGTQLMATGGERYSWSPASGLNNPLIGDPKASPAATTTYRVVGTDDIGCFSDTGFVAVKVYPIPTVNAGEDKTINIGQTVDLIPVISDDVTGVNWSPTSGVFRNNYPGIAAKPSQSTEYTVEVVNEGGCRARDLVSVYVLCNNANVFIPNTFSPNGDGTNDIFYARGGGLFMIRNMRIFNRWGDIVFERGNMYPNDASVGWDGTFKGQKLTPDVFVYTIDIVCDNNTILTYKGNIALIK
ncbi:MAG: PKD domain-containing protein [Ginsengibacter sp.]